MDVTNPLFVLAQSRWQNTVVLLDTCPYKTANMYGDFPLVCSHITHHGTSRFADFAECSASGGSFNISVQK